MPKYDVEIDRISYGSYVAEVEADNPVEAERKARSIAGDCLYSEYDVEYEISNVIPKLSEADQKVVDMGRGLLDGCTPDGGDNPEYTRAILELVYDLTTLNKREVAKALGLLIESLYKRCADRWPVTEKQVAELLADYRNALVEQERTAPVSLNDRALEVIIGLVGERRAKKDGLI